jgi:hypothetical protein
VNVVLGQALRWWVKPVAQLDDVVRVIDGRDDRLLLVLAAGYATGFDTCWAAGSRLLLQLFEDGWAVYDEMNGAFEHVCSEFAARAAELVPPEEVGGPAGSLMVAELAAREVTVTWIGEHRAVILRDGEQIVVAPSHTLGSQIAAQGLGPEFSPHAHIMTRAIGIPPAEPEVSRATLQPGDTLALLGGGAARLDADLTGRNADAIVERAMSDRARPPSNAVALLAYIG